MALLYADENFDAPVVLELRALGHDVLTAGEAGKAGLRIPDSDVLAYSISLGRCVLTFDRRDFIRLHSAVRPHKGIIVCTRDDDSLALAGRIHQAIISRATLDNQLIRIVRPAP